MCAMFTDDPAGNPVKLTTNVALADVMLPAASFVVTIVIDALPLTVDSAFVTGGTSFAGDSAAVNVGFVGVVGVGVVELLQPAARKATATAMGDRRFIVRLSF
jgi:hypothetical protein